VVASLAPGSDRTLDGVRVVPFVYKHRLSTDGTTSWLYQDLSLPQVRRWGPHLTEIVAHTMTQALMTHFQWKVVFYWSVDGLTWQGPVDLFSPEITANGMLIHTPYSTDSTLGLHMRFALAARNAPGQGGAVLNATVTCACAFDFRR
jgi:hypothetical protein